jgi:hypothetical protein
LVIGGHDVEEIDLSVRCPGVGVRHGDGVKVVHAGPGHDVTEALSLVFARGVYRPYR